jgi:ribosomal protein S18 acetylase RimI-like enzyme
MLTNQIVIIKSESELEQAFSLMKELRPHITLQNFLDIYHQSNKTTGYEIAALKQDGQIVAIMGYRILYDYVHGKHCYIDDLVSSEQQRSKGFGAELLKFAEQFAKENQCTGLRLCTGTENERGKKFYEKNGWNLRAIVYKKKC